MRIGLWDTSCLHEVTSTSNLSGAKYATGSKLPRILDAKQVGACTGVIPRRKEVDHGEACCCYGFQHATRCMECSSVCEG